MIKYLDREILIQRGNQWLALEGDHWYVMLRLLKIYGLDDKIYAPPEPGQRSSIDSLAVQKLVECIKMAMDDLPNEDLWRFYGNDPDPRTTPPHEFISGAGGSYFETLLGFVGKDEVFIELPDPGTEYRFQGESSNRPG